MMETPRSHFSKIICLRLLTLAAGFLVGCQPHHSPAPPGLEVISSIAAPTYAELFTKIFQPKCVGCHTGPKPDLTSFETLINSGTVSPGQPYLSSLFTRVDSGNMPLGAPFLEDQEVQLIYDWIEAGAKKE